MQNLKLEERALEIATRAHNDIGQVRKYTNEPYINHPIAVAEIVRSVGGNSIQIAAAYLHDTIEDTPMTEEELRTLIADDFGDQIADELVVMVSGLTDVSTRADGNRETRKRIDREHTAVQTPNCKTIKIADLLNNTESILEHDADFAKIYMKEKKLLLEVLEEGNKTLYAKAMMVVHRYFTENQ